MIFCGNVNAERLIMHPDDNPHSSHYIDIVTDKDDPVFYVTCCCDEDWEWKFWYSKTNYEVVKYIIMDCIIASETMDELIDALDEIFEEEWKNILFEEDNWECNEDCENCGFNEN